MNTYIAFELLKPKIYRQDLVRYCDKNHIKTKSVTSSTLKIQIYERLRDKYPSSWFQRVDKIMRKINRDYNMKNPHFSLENRSDIWEKLFDCVTKTGFCSYCHNSIRYDRAHFFSIISQKKIINKPYCYDCKLRVFYENKRKKLKMAMEIFYQLEETEEKLESVAEPEFVTKDNPEECINHIDRMIELGLKPAQIVQLMAKYLDYYSIPGTDPTNFFPYVNESNDTILDQFKYHILLDNFLITTFHKCFESNHELKYSTVIHQLIIFNELEKCLDKKWVHGLIQKLIHILEPHTSSLKIEPFIRALKTDHIDDGYFQMISQIFIYSINNKPQLFSSLIKWHLFVEK